MPTRSGGPPTRGWPNCARRSRLVVEPRRETVAELGGARGIRTPGPLRASGFQDRRLRPLGHRSVHDRRITRYLARLFGEVAESGRKRLPAKKVRGDEPLRGFKSNPLRYIQL